MEPRSFKAINIVMFAFILTKINEKPLFVKKLCFGENYFFTSGRT